jgi:Uma2 family endonuclease
VVTYEEWIAMPEVEGIEEVLSGHVREMPPHKWNHARVVEQLAHQLRAQLNPQLTCMFTTVFGLVIRRDPLTTRVPDLAVFVASQMVEEDGYVHSAPELVVEVMSAGNSRMQHAAKLKDYESLGVPEVWVISPDAQTVEVLLLKGGRLTANVPLRGGRLLPTHFPGVAVDIASIWPE